MTVNANLGERLGTAAQHTETRDANTHRDLPMGVEVVGGPSRSPVAFGPAAPRREEVR